ncbi:MAG: STAS domain-containing protein [Sedimentisphaerales bacterium]|nr:STAS domain-containing protein [Sedimentisphaerales bacterium]
MGADKKNNVVEITSEGKAAVVSFRAASISNVEEITAASRQIKEFIESEQPKEVIVDFECVKFFSSAVLGLLLDIRAKLKAYDGEVVISSINPQLYRVFKITHLDRIFKFFPDKENAVRAVNTD